jgi:hypothetical protein
MFMDAGRLVGGAAVLDADIERVIVWHLFDPRLPADAIPELAKPERTRQVEPYTVGRRIQFGSVGRLKWTVRVAFGISGP